MRERKGDATVAINAISDATETMHRILESTLDFAKPLKLSRSEEDIALFILRAVSSCTKKAEDHG